MVDNIVNSFPDTIEKKTPAYPSTSVLDLGVMVAGAGVYYTNINFINIGYSGLLSMA